MYSLWISCNVWDSNPWLHNWWSPWPLRRARLHLKSSSLSKFINIDFDSRFDFPYSFATNELEKKILAYSSDSILLWWASLTFFQPLMHDIPVTSSRYSCSSILFDYCTMAESTEETKKAVERHCRNERKRRPPAKRQVAAQATYSVPDDVLPNAIQCTKVPSGTRLNIEALKNTGILSQILTEIIEKDGECKQKARKRKTQRFWKNRRFIYEKALNDADEFENEEELLTMDGISPNSASTLCQLD